MLAAGNPAWIYLTKYIEGDIPSVFDDEQRLPDRFLYQ